MGRAARFIRGLFKLCRSHRHPKRDQQVHKYSLGQVQQIGARSEVHCLIGNHHTEVEVSLGEKGVVATDR